MEPDIEEVARKIMYPLTPLRTKGRVVHDSAIIGAKCPRNHIHRYYIRDVLSSPNGISACVTCSQGSRFSNLVRETVEDMMIAPFVLLEGVTKIGPICYHNPVLKLTLCCKRASGNDFCEVQANKAVIMFHHTTSAKRIRETIYQFYLGITSLSDEICRRINESKPVIALPTAQPLLKRSSLPALAEMDEDLEDIIPGICIEDMSS